MARSVPPKASKQAQTAPGGFLRAMTSHLVLLRGAAARVRARIGTGDQTPRPRNHLSWPIGGVEGAQSPGRIMRAGASVSWRPLRSVWRQGLAENCQAPAHPDLIGSSRL